MLVQFKFITKKLLALSLGRVFNYLYPRELPIILNYHGIADRIINGSIFDVEYKEFISQIHYLASLNFRFISLSKLIYLLKNKGLESNYCLITFDDCPHSFLKGAEYLTKLNIPFAAFICYDYAEKNGNWCDWNILREIEEYMPIEYGSHGIFHRRFDKLAVFEACKEIKESFVIMKKYLKKVTRTISLPYGKYSVELLENINKIGIDAIFLTDVRKKDKKLLKYSAFPRIPIDKRDTQKTFIYKIKGYYNYL